MKIVAITACPAGVAHTYMAAKALEKEAMKRGHEIYIEKQGTLGIDDELTEEQIEQADVVVFAVSVAVEDEERFEGKKIVDVEIGDVLGKTSAILDIIEGQ